uniref:Lysozyme C, milk isozyme-like isoform X2 n=1 Tax=Geotrypetes seraphini TaxID=260995 RepID=A0A6P8Q8P1_GEOSA|nr:lysozyme C, milk isozyme-like isoform X2 [Geotrypetes seraphini]
MKICILLIFLGICVRRSEALGACDVIEAARIAMLDGFKGYSAENYACLANSASQYNTSFQGSPSEYGMFQISNFWCNSKSGENNPCGISCAKLMDSNISDDIQCVKRIVQDPKGLDSWDPWVNSCKGRDLIGFICKT